VTNSGVAEKGRKERNLAFLSKCQDSSFAAFHDSYASSLLVRQLIDEITPSTACLVCGRGSEERERERDG
jgi:hypothetical protein